MILIPGKPYGLHSAMYCLQVNVPEGQEAIVNVKLNTASKPVATKYTEDTLVSGFVGRGEITVENAACEFNISPNIS